MVRNGFTWPYNSLQVLSWALFFILAGTFYSLTLPPLDLQMQILSGISYSVVTIFTCTFWYKVSSIDPTDPAVKAAVNSKISGNEPNLPDLSKLCTKCKVYVHKDSKHCWECNRCVINFDHHCKWLNNCVGKMNYRPFIGTILSLLGLMVIQILSSIYLLIAIESDWEEKENAKEMYGYAKTTIGWLCIYHVAIVILSSLIIISAGFLLGFHVWLTMHHMTTYQLYCLRRVDKAKKSNKTTPDSNPNASIQRDYEPYVMPKEEDEELPFKIDRGVPKLLMVENSIDKGNPQDNTFYHSQIAEELKQDKFEINTHKENLQYSTIYNSQLCARYETR